MNPEYIINPESGRRIKVGGRTWKNLYQPKTVVGPIRPVIRSAAKTAILRNNITQTLTGNPDIDKILLIGLSPESFKSSTMVNKNYQNISNDQLIWKQRLID